MIRPSEPDDRVPEERVINSLETVPTCVDGVMEGSPQQFRINPSQSQSSVPRSMMLAAGTGSRDRIDVSLVYGNLRLRGDAALDDYAVEPTLGMDFLMRNKCRWDVGRGTLEIDGVTVPLQVWRGPRTEPPRRRSVAGSGTGARLVREVAFSWALLDGDPDVSRSVVTHVGCVQKDVGHRPDVLGVLPSGF